MILKALTDYYEILRQENKVAGEGWSIVKVSYAITLNRQGQVTGIVSLMKTEERKGKEILVPNKREVPIQRKRSGTKPIPYLLCDKAQYLLGAWKTTGNIVDDTKAKKEARDDFESSRQLHYSFFKQCKSPLAQSISSFFDNWDYERDKERLNVDWDSIIKAPALVFRDFDTGQEIQTDEEIVKTWDKNNHLNEEAPQRVCMVTGKRSIIARTHPNIKGMKGVTPSGAPLVCFNQKAFESYGKKQGDNAQVSEYVANAYAKALNYLLEDGTHHRLLGETTIVFWVQAIQSEEVYTQFIAQLLDGRKETEEEKLLKIIDTIAKGESCEFLGTELLPETKSFVLGLSPNEGRISVRFFYESSFGELLSHINAHYERLSIESPKYETKQYPSVLDILYETVNKNAKNKVAQPILIGALMQSVLQDTLYPAALYSHVMLRIHAERTINRNRAAILKAYLIKNHPQKKEAINTMTLNEETEYLPYVLGRMFAVLEDIQSSAIGKETLRERYFNAASSTPAVVFPQLIKLSNSHMRVLARENKGLQIVKEKELENLFGKMHSNFPANLSLEDQGIFMIGYYHQVQARYQKEKGGLKDGRSN